MNSIPLHYTSSIDLNNFQLLQIMSPQSIQMTWNSVHLNQIKSNWKWSAINNNLRKIFQLRFPNDTIKAFGLVVMVVKPTVRNSNDKTILRFIDVHIIFLNRNIAYIIHRHTNVFIWVWRYFPLGKMDLYVDNIYAYHWFEHSIRLNDFGCFKFWMCTMYICAYVSIAMMYKIIIIRWFGSVSLRIVSFPSFLINASNDQSIFWFTLLYWLNVCRTH